MENGRGAGGGPRPEGEPPGKRIELRVRLEPTLDRLAADLERNAPSAADHLPAIRAALGGHHRVIMRCLEEGVRDLDCEAAAGALAERNAALGRDGAGRAS